MLVLSRRIYECVRIGDDITITVVQFKGDKVRLGIEAPRDVSVHRGEVYDAIQRSGVDNTRRPGAERPAGHQTPEA